MRGRVAKRIRKEVYGDMSYRGRIYAKDKNGGLVNVGLRAKYLEAKKTYKKAVKEGQK